MAVSELAAIGPVGNQYSADGAQRILFLIDELESISNGGTERQILQLIQLARRLGYAPCLAVLRGTRWLCPEQAGCPIYFAEVYSLFRPAGWRALLQLVGWMRQQKFALVQTFFMESNLAGPWLARLAGVPVVVGSRRNLNHSMGPVTLLLQRLANLSVDCIVANSHVAAQTVAAKEWLPQRKLRVAYNGVDLAKFAGQESRRAHARRMLGICEEEILVGNISCFRPVKGMLHFVEAARIVSRTDDRMHFVVVGDGEQHALAVEQARRYGLESRFHFAGAQTDVIPYLAAMDIGVLSSEAEGFSNSVLEYMASGLAVVATDVGGNREALGDIPLDQTGAGETGMCQAGILVPPKSASALAVAILRLGSAELRQRLGAAGPRRAELFSVMRAERRMEELYGEMLTWRSASG